MPLKATTPVLLQQIIHLSFKLISRPALKSFSKDKHDKPLRLSIASLLISSQLCFASELSTTHFESVRLGNGLQAVLEDETLKFITENGRFMLDGEVYDLWHQEKLTTFEQVKRAVSTINLDALDFDIQALAPMVWGKGAKEIVIFLDPECQYCQKLLQLAKHLITEYRFLLIPIPLLGQNSIDAVKKLTCSDDKSLALDALINHDYSQLGMDYLNSCQLGIIQKRLITAQIFGIQSVPYLISSDGRIHTGLPKNLTAWLEGME